MLYIYIYIYIYIYMYMLYIYIYIYMSWVLFESLKISIVPLERSIKKMLKLYGPYLWMGFNCLNAIEPLRGDSLLFIRMIKFSRIIVELYLPLSNNARFCQWYYYIPNFKLLGFPTITCRGVFLADNLL